MTVKGGTTPACAACKYQRRKCSPNCPLAPYFPANQPKMFQNVHRLFGVSNVTKILKNLKTKLQRDDAMQSIIFESNARELYPVDGCIAVIRQLQRRLAYALHEHQCVYNKLAACRNHLNKSGSTHYDFGSGSNSVYVPGRFEFGSGSGTDVVLPMLANDNNHFFSEDSGSYSDFNPDFMSNSNLSIQEIQQQMTSFGIQPFSHSQDYEESVMNSTDQKLSQIETKEGFAQIETKEAVESSSDTKRSTVDHTCRRDLKNAAAGLSLTNVN